jgi:hypothetical protein
VEYMGELMAAWNRPVAILNRMGLVLRQIPDQSSFSSRERLAMLALVNDLSQYVHFAGLSVGQWAQRGRAPIP